MINAVVTAYYPEALKSAEVARARAQNGFTMASAVAAALVAGGIVGGLSGEEEWVTLIGLAALIVWLGAAALFVIAVAVDIGQPTPEDARTASGFAESALRLVRDERQTVERRAIRAQVAAGIALLLTVACLAGLVLSDEPPALVRGLVLLTPTGAHALSSQCSVRNGGFQGSVELSSLDDTIVEVLTTKCGARRHVHLRSAVLAGFAQDRK